MTSPIPMFIPYQVLDKCLYLKNTITDPEGICIKINSSNIFNNWKELDLKDSACFNEKINHTSNLFFQEIYFEKTEDLKNKYILNSLSMSFSESVKKFASMFMLSSLDITGVKIFKESKPEKYDPRLVTSEKNLAILFLNDSLACAPIKLLQNGNTQDIVPQRGSMLVVPKGTSYNLGYLEDKVRIYCTYEFDLIQ